MTIKEALIKFNKTEVELLLAHVLKKPKEFLYMNPAKSLSAKQLISLLAMIKRRQKGEPIAYILGYKDFMGLRFKVNRNVLIPRPETEDLVNKVLQVCSSYVPKGIGTTADKKVYKVGRPLKILDVGTGSGCIAVSIAVQLHKNQVPSNKCQIIGSDISKDALNVARANAKAHKVKIKFIHSNILKNVRMSYDILVANLPYVPIEDFRLLNADLPVRQAGLRYEPKNAIFAKEKGLALIKKFLHQLSTPTPSGRGSDQSVGVINYQSSIIFLEFDPRQKILLHSLIKKHLPGRQVKFYKDFSNFWRYVEIK